MSYVSLARKYRPRRFVDMVGQESTTLALTNAIRLRREPHSVIFTGVRGIGKTTSARIYAKALNCEAGPTAEPCDVCASCQAIATGNHEDVLEIDGASNTGVDDVRALQETLSYVPQRSTYKIYIIDEVHMLSISAFNALLKTLEEPPQHVVFIFATTELHKVPETIQSRCQTFHLQKISRPVIADRVRSILTAEGIPFEEAALAIVAREGRGSMRDALTMLDQAIAVGGGQVTLDALKNMVGSSSQALPVLELLDGLLRKDASQILEVIARWDQEGLAMSTLVEETAKACRNAFILRDLKGQAIDLQLLELEDREQQMLLELGEKAAPMDLNRLFRQLAKCLDDLRHADLDRFILENYCLEWCFDPGLPDLQTLMNIISSGQPLPQVAARPAAPQAAPTSEGPAINLRERWKTSSPNVAAPAARPAAAPQPSPPQPAPLAKPAAPLQKTTTPQASLDKPLAPTPGPAAMSQTAAQPMAMAQNGGMPSSLLQKLAMAQATQAAAPAPQPAVNPLSMRPAPQAQPRPVIEEPTPQTGARQGQENQSVLDSTAHPGVQGQPASLATSDATARPNAVSAKSNVTPPASQGNARSNLAHPAQESQPAVNMTATHPGMQSQASTKASSRPTAEEEPVATLASKANTIPNVAPVARDSQSAVNSNAAQPQGQAVSNPAAQTNAKSNVGQTAIKEQPAIDSNAAQPQGQAASIEEQPAVNKNALPPQPGVNAAADVQPTSANPRSLRSMLESAAQSTATSTVARPQQPAANGSRPAANPAAPARNGGSARPNGPAMPPEPPPFDLNDDDVPPWLLQEEASRQGAMAAPIDEPMMPEPPKNEGFLKQMARRAANETPAPPPPAKVETPPPPVATAPSDPVWPENWRAFVDEWKKQKPLQGRVLEEAYLLEYTPERIRLAVEPTSMAGGKLLQQDVRKRLMEQFTQLFGFKGILEAVPKADAHPGKTSNGGTAPDLGETLLDVKNREREVAREQLRHRLEEHPMTREVISRFGGTIEQIELQ